MRRRLSNTEREIRSSRGIVLWRALPLLTILILLEIMTANAAMWERCLGYVPEFGGSTRLRVLERLMAGVACSPYYPTSSPSLWAVVVIYWGTIPVAVAQIIFLGRHMYYWNRIRSREKQKRADKMVKKGAEEQVTAKSSTQTPR